MTKVYFDDWDQKIAKAPAVTLAIDAEDEVLWVHQEDNLIAVERARQLEVFRTKDEAIAMLSNWECEFILTCDTAREALHAMCGYD